MSALVFGSVCSGIEAASVAWAPLGWRCAFVSETAPFPRAVLAHHYPEVPLHGDFTKIGPRDVERIDVLVGGTPCQSFSVAGRRGGMADERGNLALEFLALAERLGARWLVWENVPGVLSSDEGRDFGLFLGRLGELGFGWAYRTLDAQHFGVPQRRRRIILVGCAGGDWRGAAAVLFERACLSGDSAPRRQAREGVAPTISSRPTGGGGLGTDFDLDGGLIAETLRNHPRPGSNSLGAIAFGGNDTTGPIDVATARNAHGGPHGRVDFESETFIAHTLGTQIGFATEDGTGRGSPLVPVCFSAKDHGADAETDLAPTPRAGGHAGSHANAGVMPAIASHRTQALTPSGNRVSARGGDVMIDPQRYGGSNQDTLHHESGVLNTLPGGSHQNGGHYTKSVIGPTVRRLTPRECERLQGFPDDWTLIPWRGKLAPDGPRYKAVGNSMAVPVMAWVGRRIALVEALASDRAADPPSCEAAA